MNVTSLVSETPRLTSQTLPPSTNFPSFVPSLKTADPPMCIKVPTPLPSSFLFFNPSSNALIKLESTGPAQLTIMSDSEAWRTMTS